MDNQNDTGQQNDQQNTFGQRKMYQGKWACAGCGTEITELPFEPDGDRPIFCRDCYRNRRPSRPQRQY